MFCDAGSVTINRNQFVVGAANTPTLPVKGWGRIRISLAYNSKPIWLGVQVIGSQLRNPQLSIAIRDCGYKGVTSSDIQWL
jgi:hypothetical protein